MNNLLRRSLKSLGFSTPVLLLTAVAVLVNASVFAGIYALVWKPLPFRDADRLVEMRIDLRDVGMQVALSETFYRQIRENPEVFAGAVGTVPAPQGVVDTAGRAWRVQRVTVDFLDVLGAAPALGRSFAGDASEAARTVLISDGMWRTRLGGTSDVLGSVLRLKGIDYTVVGIMPPGFSYPEAGADAWVPYVPTSVERDQEALGGFGMFQVVARLAPGVNVAQARAALASLFEASPSLTRMRGTGARFQADVRPLRERYSSGYLDSLALMQAAAGLLLIVVAANLAYLMLMRLDARHREFDVCRALGARQRDLMRMILGDVAPPALAGVLLGILLTPLGVRLIDALGLLPAALPNAIGTDVAVVVVAFATAAVCAAIVLLTAIPTLARRIEMSGLRERNGASGIGPLRAAILVAQVALTTSMLGAGALLSRSALNLATEPLGFEADNIVITGVDLSEMQANAGLDAAALAGVGERLRRRLAAYAGVTAVETSNSPPFSDASFMVKARAKGDRDVDMRSHEVSPGYFRALGISPLKGKLDDAPATGSVVVDERFVQQAMAPGTDPVGTTIRISLGDDQGYRDAQVLAVVPRARQRAIDEQDENGAIYDLSPTTGNVFFLVSRVSGDPVALAEALGREVREAAPEAVITGSRALRETVDATLARRWAALKLIALFSIVTLGLAALGLYAALRLNLRRRTSEIGVRMALGATARHILRRVMIQGGRLIAAGLAAGLLIGLLLARSVADWLYRLPPHDPVAWSIACVCVLLPALLACWLPARRATRVEPKAALMAD
ncbi:MAG: ABC transporter permease [Lysobacter sp.]|nr:ABC transporter permease [Lysobacter sp.]